MVHNSLMPLIILMLKWFQIWPIEATSFAFFLFFFKELSYLLTTKSASTSNYPVPALQSAISLRSPGSLEWGNVLEIKILVQSVFTATLDEVLLNPFSK